MNLHNYNQGKMICYNHGEPAEEDHSSLQILLDLRKARRASLGEKPKQTCTYTKKCDSSEYIGNLWQDENITQGQLCTCKIKTTLTIYTNSTTKKMQERYLINIIHKEIDSSFHNVFNIL